MCASTLWPLSNSTRNIALGRVSKTLPVTSIASSLGINRLSRFQALDLAQNIRAVLGDGDGMFKVCRQAPVLGHGRPAIFLDFYFVAAHIHHGLDCQHHAFAQTDTTVRLTVVWHWGFL